MFMNIANIHFKLIKGSFKASINLESCGVKVEKHLVQRPTKLL